MPAIQTMQKIFQTLLNKWYCNTNKELLHAVFALQMCYAKIVHY